MIIEEGGDIIEHYHDELSDLHLSILKMLGIEKKHYWQTSAG